VTITKTTRRRDSLALDAERPELVPEKRRRAFFFGSREDFSLENPAPILGATFLRAGRPELRPLIAPKQSPRQTSSSVIQLGTGRPSASPFLLSRCGPPKRGSRDFTRTRARPPTQNVTGAGAEGRKRRYRRLLPFT
jgi:hypothetical protein